MSEKCDGTCSRFGSSRKSEEIRLTSSGVPIPSSQFAICRACPGVEDDVRAAIDNIINGNDAGSNSARLTSSPRQMVGGGEDKQAGFDDVERPGFNDVERPGFDDVKKNGSAWDDAGKEGVDTKDFDTKGAGTEGHVEKVGGAVGVLSPKTGMRIVLAVLVVSIIICVVWWLTKRKKSKEDRFYTLYAEEQPTRPYVPYVGTIPYGTWGVKPWAMAFDLAPPSKEYSYLPPRYRDPTDIL